MDPLTPNTQNPEQELSAAIPVEQPAPMPEQVPAQPEAPAVVPSLDAITHRQSIPASELPEPTPEAAPVPEVPRPAVPEAAPPETLPAQPVPEALPQAPTTPEAPPAPETAPAQAPEAPVPPPEIQTATWDSTIHSSAQPAPVPEAAPQALVSQEANPAIADDVDVIEKEWVDRAEQVVKATEGDPYKEERAMEELRADYLKKRFGIDINTDRTA